jgi:hypothetical protein
MKIKNALQMTLDLLPDIKIRFSSLSDSEVLVGVPEDESKREGDGPSNAMLAYTHDNGSPAINIPARPFMVPGIKAAKKDILRVLKIGAENILDGGKETGNQTLHKVGLIAQLKIRAAINEGIPPPLADSTLKARIRARRGVKGAKAELALRKTGEPPSLGLAKPLINTGQLRNSINYVVRKKKNG